MKAGTDSLMVFVVNSALNNKCILVVSLFLHNP